MDSKAIAVNGFRSAREAVLADLNSLPEEAFDRRFGGKARTVADIVHEINTVNDHLVYSIRGEAPPEWTAKGWITAPDDRREKAAAITAFDQSSARFLEALEALKPEQLADKVSTEHGETDKFERARFAATHLWYHSGQFNFIQTLLGDDDWHWG